MNSRVLIAATLAAMTTVAAAGETAADQVVIDRTTQRVLFDACTYLRSAERFSARFDVTFDDVLLDGTKVQYSRRSELAMVRPDRLRANIEDDRGERSVYYDGRSVTVYRPGSGLYAVVQAPDNLDAMLDLAAEKGISLPLDDLLRMQPCAVLGERLRSGTYAGLHYLDGDWYHHLLLATDTADVQMWVARGEAPTIRKVVITYTQKPGAPEYSALISDWDFTSNIDDTYFRFEPLAGTRQVVFRGHGATQGGAEQ
ncbi:MAG: DUF2092 domain-containing protein [Gammaproteobacteria bacterium]